MSADLKGKGKTILEAVKEFMTTEQVNQRRILEITGNKEVNKEPAKTRTCFLCKKQGHVAADCTKGSSGGGKKSHSTRGDGAAATKKCPVCSATYTWKGIGGRTLISTRFSNCDVF